MGLTLGLVTTYHWVYPKKQSGLTKNKLTDVSKAKPPKKRMENQMKILNKKAIIQFNTKMFSKLYPK